MTSILLADDHPAICFALQVLLEKNDGFRVASSSGENLIARLHRDCPDLLVLDLDLKHADGLDLLPRIKHHFPALKVLIFTNQPAHIYALRTLQAGAHGYISKTISLTMLEPVLQLLLAGYQCFPEGIGNTLAGQYGGETEPGDVIAQLSDREIAVLTYLRQGLSNKEIADKLMLSNKTISTYKARMMKKAGTDDIATLFTLLNDESAV